MQHQTQGAAVVEGFFEAVARRDIASAFGHLDPRVEWSAPHSLPYGGTFHGLGEVGERYFPGFLQHVDDDFELRLEEVIVSADRVIARARLSGHGRMSGRPFDVPVVQLWTISGERASRLEYHADTAAILDALEVEPAGRSMR